MMTVRTSGISRILPAQARPSAAPLEFHERELEDSVAARLARVWAGRASSIAVRGINEAVSFGKLDAWAGGIARRLAEQKAAPEAGVALLLPDDVQAVAAMLGVLKFGSYFIPLDWRAPADYVSGILKASRTRTLLTTRLCAPQAEALGPLLDRTLYVDEVEWAEGYPAAPGGPSFPFSLHFTSGSTGEPKGVLQRQGVLLAEIRRQTRDLSVVPGDRFGWTLPAVSTSSLRDIFGALLAGAELQPIEVHSRDFREIAKHLRRAQTTIVHMTPTLFRQVAARWEVLAPPKSLRVLSLGTEPVLRIDFDLYRRHLPSSCAFQNVYGSTETRVAAQCFLTASSMFEGEQVPAGWPVDGKDIRIVDEEGKEAPAGETGTVCVRSRYLPEGYWNLAEESRLRFHEVTSEPGIRDYMTGDYGALDQDGMLHLHGRRDTQAKIRGHRVDLTALEARLLTHPWIEEAAAKFASSAGAQREGIVVYIVLGEDRYLGVEQIRRYVAEALPAYMVPAYVSFLEILPRLPGGKLDRKALPEVRPVEVPGGSARRAPSPREAEMAAIWGEVLGVPEVPVDVNFFDLGGDSILAGSLSEAIRTRLGATVSMRLIFENATVAELVDRIDQLGGTAQEGRLVHLNGGGSRPVLYLLPGRRGGAISFQKLAEFLGKDQPVTAIEYKGTHGEAVLESTVEAMARTAIDDLRASGARGPFRFGGSSVGGVIAFEIARQLQAAGEPVACVMLFDSEPPRTEHNGGADALGFKGRRLRKFFDRGAAASRLRGLADALTVRASLAMRREVPPLVLRRHQREVFERAMATYRAEPLPVRLTLFRACGYGDPGSADRITRAWQSLTTVGLEIRDVRGSHVLIREPHVRLLAAEVNDVLESLAASPQT